MCTAATYKTKDFYFGRTLDYEFSYSDEVVITPRSFPFEFTDAGSMPRHYAFVGAAYVVNDYPLYFDGINEKGLGIAGLNFVGNAVYHDPVAGKINLAQYELIPYILGSCATVAEAKEKFKNIIITGKQFSPELPAAQLHWIVADKDGAITVESVADGVKIYDNNVGVLTNNPPFESQMLNLCNYMGLSSREPENRFCDKLSLKPYSRGMGAFGLPGDLSSESRFVRAAFVRANSVSGDGETESVSQFFHILGAVDQQRGCCVLKEGEYEITIYTTCCNATRGIYYYKTYDNSDINAVDLHAVNLDTADLKRYKFAAEPRIRFQNR